MGTVKTLDGVKLGRDESFNKALRSIIMGIHETSKSMNEYEYESDDVAYNPEGRALFSLLEELTGDVVSRDYCLEKIGMLFDE